MDFSFEGLEELFSDGVLNPRIASPGYGESCAKYREVADRVYLLHEPQQAAATFDIVLLHGIGSDEFKCWTNSQGVLWPAAFLPQDFPTARVLTVGYVHSLFNWRAPDATDAVAAASAEAPAPPVTHADREAETAQVVSSAAQGADRATTAAAAESGAVLRPLKALAKRVEQTTLDAVSTYASEGLAEWWSRPATHSPVSSGAKATPPPPPPPAEPAIAVSAASEAPHTPRTSSPESLPRREGNSLFLLLSHLRDATGSLASSGDAPAAAHRAPGMDEDASPDGRSAGPARDPRSLQSMRLVAAELAERLLSPAVGVGQRPVVFLSHSMGGLILKQMLVSLFDAVRLAPPSAAALPVVPSEGVGGTEREAALSSSHVAIQQASTLLRAVRGVVFYGTPHFGSAMASVITGLKKYYQGFGGLTPTSVVTGLGDHNRPELTRLNDRFFDVIERLGSEQPFEGAGAAAAVAAAHGTTALNSFVAAMEASLAPAPRLISGGSLPSSSSSSSGGTGGVAGTSCASVSVLSFGETEKLNGLVRVVGPESANPAPDDPRYPFYLVDADHSQINRPRTKTSPSYAMLYGLLDRMQQRGLLAEHGGGAAGCVSATGLLAAPPASPVASDAPALAAAEAMRRRYEAGWAALFDPASSLSAPAADRVAERTPVSAGVRDGGAEDTRAAGFRQGLGEARLALALLDGVLVELRQLLRRYFGVALPPQLDAVFLLATDVREFVQSFYSRQRASAATVALSGGGEGAYTELGGDGYAHVDEVVSFCVPLQLVTYWARVAAAVLRCFERAQQERALRVGGGAERAGYAGSVGSSSSTSGRMWEMGAATMHASSRDIRELSELERTVGVVQEEWEGYRRFVSLRMRSCAFAASERAATARRLQPGTTVPPQAAGGAAAPVAEHIAILFFSRSMRAVVGDQLRDGGALGGLLSAYLRSAAVQVRGSELHVGTAYFDGDPWSPLLHAVSPDGSSVIASVMDGLELTGPSSCATQSGVILVDSSSTRVQLTAAAELRAIAPSLAAASAMLLGFFCLFVDDLAHLDASGASRWSAAHHFRLATAALDADTRVRWRLLRAASHALQGGEASEHTKSGDGAPARRLRSANRDWWRAGWERGFAKTAAAGGVAGITAADAARGAAGDGHTRHVAVLDDGMLLSAVQLVAAAFQCSLLLNEWHATRPLLSPAMGTQGAEPSRGAVCDPPSFAAPLLSAVRAAQKAYERTSQITRGLHSAYDATQPFGSARSAEAVVPASARKEDEAAQEKSARERIRDAVQHLLQELDSDGPDKSRASESSPGCSHGSTEGTGHRVGGSAALPPETAARTAAVSATTSTGSTRSASRRASSSLPMFIMGSLAKAWEAVRRGDAASETAEYFAYNAMTMWWVVEREAAAALETFAVAHSAPEPADGDEASDLPGAASHGSGAVREMLAVLETAQQRRRMASSVSSGGPAAPPRRAHEGTATAERQCWSHANAAQRCRWLTVCGGNEYQRALESELAQERRLLHRLEATALLEELREVQTLLTSPATTTQVGPETGARQAVPSTLLDALREDDANAELRCWLGHCYSTHRMASPDAAHAYLQVIRNDSSRSKALTAAAEVGLAWNHLHRVPCSAWQVWRGPIFASPHAAAAAGGAPRDDDSVCRDTAALLAYEGGAVVDTAALHSAPATLQRFHRDAVLHHSRAVQEYRCSASASALTGGGRPSSLVPARSRPPDISGPVVSVSHLWHLRLAEEGFRRALRTDPTNIGALCGLGRLRSLSTARGDVPASSWTASSELLSSSPPLDTVGQGDPASAAALPYFQVVSRHTPATGAGCPHAMDAVWASYAAYWMSAECRRTAPGAALQASATTEWLRRSVQLYPRNDWALTGLGLSYLERVSPCLPDARGEDARRDGGRNVAVSPASQESERYALCGLALLQRALMVNPANTWALWGVGTFAKSTAHRDACQRLLRSLLVAGIRAV